MITSIKQALRKTKLIRQKYQSLQSQQKAELLAGRLVIYRDKDGKSLGSLLKQVTDAVRNRLPTREAPPDDAWAMSFEPEPLPPMANLDEEQTWLESEIASAPTDDIADVLRQALFFVQQKQALLAARARDMLPGAYLDRQVQRFLDHVRDKLGTESEPVGEIRWQSPPMRARELGLRGDLL